jgi:peptide methionine sulfoxide reductase MsrB
MKKQLTLSAPVFTLAANNNYLRIGEPGVYAEVACGSVVYFSQIHYYSIYCRDVRSYGNTFKF